MKSLFRIMLILIMVVMSILFLSCNGNNIAPSESLPSSITSAVQSIDVHTWTDNFTPGVTQQFTATVYGPNNPTQAVSWSVSGNISPQTSINSSGLLTIASNETAVALTIYASSPYSSSVFGAKIIRQADISFGGYSWIPLDRVENRILIISRDIIDMRRFHPTSGVTWDNSSLREYLNGAFYDSFNATDQARIVEVMNINESNQWNGAPGGSSTLDKIFLLSLSEVVRYFGDSGQLFNPLMNPNNGLLKDQFNPNRIATFRGTEAKWWLRSPISSSFLGVGYASLVLDSGEMILYGGYYSESIFGVRPVLWLSLY